ncbi:MAG: exo-beta-N-acetylmuramidase NamZ domain-containing protein [Desulfobacterales bacterium]
MQKVQTGLENLIHNPPAGLEKKRLALLCNPASVDSRFRHARDLIDRRFPGALKTLFSPQHGFFAEKQDNMVESDDLTDSRLSMPVFSLYGATRTPTDAMLDKFDVLIVDLQDVGTRVYTFFTTLSYCMEAAAKTGKSVLVADRPNPVGGVQVAGNCLNPEYASFVGRYPIPMRHGLTIGEYARYINQAFEIGCELSVIPMKGWKRGMYFDDTGLAWIAPSPNLPTPVSVQVYPGQVIWEGTNISEGRGTALPFELFGAPFLDTDAVRQALGGTSISGAVLRPAVFEPTSGKWAQTPCSGFQIHVTDRYQFEPYTTSLKLLSAVLACHPDELAWKAPPYEYEWEKLPFDLITGDPEIRRQLSVGADVAEMARAWQPEVQKYLREVRQFYLYDE